MKKFLCIIITRDTRETIAEYNDIEAEDWYYARHKAAALYRKDNPDKSDDKNWAVDSLELDMRVELHKPLMDKGYSIQFFGDTSIIRDSVIKLLRDPMIREARLFLQGDSKEWLMLEFWNDNPIVIQLTVKYIEDNLKIKIIKNYEY